MSELSAIEVEQLLRSATVHRQINQQNHQQTHSRREEHCFYNHQHERGRLNGCDLRDQGQRYSSHLLRSNTTEKDLGWPRKPGPEHHYGHQESHYRRQEERNNQSNLRESHRLGNYKALGHHYGNQKDHYYSSYHVRNCAQEDRPTSRHTNGIIRSNSMVNAGRANGCPPPRSHDQEVVSAYQPQLCYTPANYIPLRDYISVDEEELYCFCPASNNSDDRNPPTDVYSGSTHSHRVPSPLYEDNAPFTILNTVDATEPITAIFMGFQPAHDDSGPGQEFEGALKAELVIIEDNEENEDDSSMKETKGGSSQAGSLANGKTGRVEGSGDRQTQRWGGPGIKKIKKKHKPCCAVC